MPFAFLNITNPLVAWLTYRGEMVSASEAHDHALSIWATRRLAALRAGESGLKRYRAELALEEHRRCNFPDAVSRLSGFFVFPDEATALRTSQEWGIFNPEHLVEIGLSAGARTSRYDSEWITGCMDGEGDFWWANSYFAGNAKGQEPLWEGLVDGRGFVFGTELRERAHEIVKRTWPRSLPLLELARVAVELNSDLGLIVAMVFRDEAQYEVRYTMNFKDARDEDFLARFAAFDGPTNTVDLRPDSDLVCPDLRPQFFTLT